MARLSINKRNIYGIEESRFIISEETPSYGFKIIICDSIDEHDSLAIHVKELEGLKQLIEEYETLSRTIN